MRTLIANSFAFLLFQQVLSRITFPVPLNLNQVINEGQSYNYTHIIKITDSDFIATIDEKKNLKIWEEENLILRAWHKMGVSETVIGDVIHIPGTFELCYFEIGGNTVKKFDFLRGIDLGALITHEYRISSLKIANISGDYKLYIKHDGESSILTNTISVFNIKSNSVTKLELVNDANNYKVEDFIPINENKIFFTLSDNSLNIYDVSNKSVSLLRKFTNSNDNILSKMIYLIESTDLALVRMKNNDLIIYNMNSFELKFSINDPSITHFDYVFKPMEIATIDILKIIIVSNQKTIRIIDYHTKPENKIIIKTSIRVLLRSPGTSLIFIGEESGSLTVENYMKKPLNMGNELSEYLNISSITPIDNLFYLTGAKGELWVTDQFSGKVLNKFTNIVVDSQINIIDARDDGILVFQEASKTSIFYNKTTRRKGVEPKIFSSVVSIQKIFKYVDGKIGFLSIYDQSKVVEIWSTDASKSIINMADYGSNYIEQINIKETANGTFLIIGTNIGSILIFNLDKNNLLMSLKVSDLNVKNLITMKDAGGLLIFVLFGKVGTKRELMKMRFAEGKLEKLISKSFDNDNEVFNSLTLTDIESFQQRLVLATEIGKIYEVDQISLEIGQVMFFIDSKLNIENLFYSLAYGLLIAYKDQKSPIYLFNFKKGLIPKEKVNVQGLSSVLSMKKTHLNNIWIVMFNNCSISTYNRYSRSFGSLSYQPEILFCCPKYDLDLKRNLLIFKEGSLMKGLNYNNFQISTLYIFESEALKTMEINSIKNTETELVLATNFHYWIFEFNSTNQLKRLFYSDVNMTEIKSLMVYSHSGNVTFLGVLFDTRFFLISVNTTDRSPKQPNFTIEGKLIPGGGGVSEFFYFFNSPIGFSLDTLKNSLTGKYLYWNTTKKYFDLYNVELNINSITGYCEAYEGNITLLIINQTEIYLYDFYTNKNISSFKIFPETKLLSVERNNEGEFIAVGEDNNIVIFSLPLIDSPSIKATTMLYPYNIVDDIVDIGVSENIGLIFLAMKSRVIKVLDIKSRIVVDNIYIDYEILKIMVNNNPNEIKIIVFHKNLAQIFNFITKKIVAQYNLGIYDIEPKLSTYFQENERLCLASNQGYYAVFNTKEISSTPVYKGQILFSQLNLKIFDWLNEETIVGITENSSTMQIIYLDVTKNASLNSKSELSNITFSISSMKVIRNHLLVQSIGDNYNKLIYVDTSNLTKKNEIIVTGLYSYQFYANTDPVVVFSDSNTSNISIWNVNNQEQSGRVNLMLYHLQSPIIGPVTSKESFLVYRPNNEKQIIEINFRGIGDTGSLVFNLPNQNDVCPNCYKSLGLFESTGNMGGLYTTAFSDMGLCELINKNKFCVACNENRCTYLNKISALMGHLVFLLFVFSFAI